MGITFTFTFLKQPLQIMGKPVNILPANFADGNKKMWVKTWELIQNFSLSESVIKRCRNNNTLPFSQLYPGGIYYYHIDDVEKMMRRRKG